MGQVDVTNDSYPTSCAEEDNIDLEFANSKIAGFVIRAVYPLYIDHISEQRSKPDFRGCPFGNGRDSASVKVAPPRKIVFFDSPDVRLVGLSFAKFWRPEQVPVTVGSRREAGLQLIQLWTKAEDRWEEVIAFYPSDGYWRLRPLLFGKMRFGSYGTSFLIGPVERNAKRPYVAIKHASYDPAHRSFRLDFARGGSAILTVDKVDHQECAVSIAFKGSLPAGRPFAAVRSMYVDEQHSDAAKIIWQDGRPPDPVLSFANRRISRLWIGRRVQSFHNNAAPDLWVGDFILRAP